MVPRRGSCCDRLTVYGLVARAFRAGRVNLGVIGTTPAQPYRPEYTTNFEAGLKTSSADGRVRANLTGFYIKWTDQQIAQVNPTNFQSGTFNAGKASSKGAEIEFSALPAKHLELDWNFGYTDGTYDKLNLSLDPQKPQKLDGNRLLFVPKITSTVAAELDLPLRDGAHTVSLRGEWRVIGKQYFDLVNNISQDSYHLLNARAAVQLRDWTVALWGRNLANKAYLQFAFPSGLTRVLLGDPRMVGVTVSARLGR